jgi:hypothetical protein
MTDSMPVGGPPAGGAARGACGALLLLMALALSGTRAPAIEIMTWVPPYAIDECRAVVEADFGVCDAEDGLTRVGLQFWLPDWDGAVRYQNLGPWGNPTDTDVAWWRAWCAAHEIDCLLTIYNHDGSSWNWDLATAAFDDHRATFVAALVAEMERHDLDGIDLDLEGIGDLDGDRAAFDQFVHELFLETAARGKILTIDSFHYIWNAPNHSWWEDWLGEVDQIHTMGYDDLYEGGTGYQRYSFQQDAAYAAGYSGTRVLMGMPGWLASWGTSIGYGTSARAHVEEVRYELAEPTGIAIWDLQLDGWQDDDLWCEIVALRQGASGLEQDPGSARALTLRPHPNPATRATMIEYHLPSRCAVAIEIHDALGRRVAALTDGVQEAGDHRLAWEAADLPAGVYVCRLRAGEATLVQRVVMVR